MSAANRTHSHCLYHQAFLHLQDLRVCPRLYGARDPVSFGKDDQTGKVQLSLVSPTSPFAMPRARLVDKQAWPRSRTPPLPRPLPCAVCLCPPLLCLWHVCAVRPCLRGSVPCPRCFFVLAFVCRQQGRGAERVLLSSIPLVIHLHADPSRCPAPAPPPSQPFQQVPQPASLSLPLPRERRRPQPPARPQPPPPSPPSHLSSVPLWADAGRARDGARRDWKGGDEPCRASLPDLMRPQPHRGILNNSTKSLSPHQLPPCSLPPASPIGTSSFHSRPPICSPQPARRFSKYKADLITPLPIALQGHPTGLRTKSKLFPFA